MQTSVRVVVCVCVSVFVAPGRLLRSWLLPGAPWGISRLPLLVDLYLHDQEIRASVQLERGSSRALLPFSWLCLQTPPPSDAVDRTSLQPGAISSQL